MLFELVDSVQCSIAREFFPAIGALDDCDLFHCLSLPNECLTREAWQGIAAGKRSLHTIIATSDKNEVKAIGAWMKKWYLQAGYKRLTKPQPSLPPVALHKQDLAGGRGAD